MQIFGTFKLLMILLGPSWLFLGPIWPQNGPQSFPKLVPKMTSNIFKIKLILDPKMDPKMGQDGGPRQQSQPAGAIIEALVSKIAPRWLKMSSNSPR